MLCTVGMVPRQIMGHSDTHQCRLLSRVAMVVIRALSVHLQQWIVAVHLLHLGLASLTSRGIYRGPRARKFEPVQHCDVIGVRCVRGSRLSDEAAMRRCGIVSYHRLR